MKALCFDGDVALRDAPDPEPGEGEALVRVRMAGVCNTDLEIVRGYMGFRGVLGHELVGEVEAHPDPAWIGRRVTAEINLACGRCRWCARGLGRHCPDRTVLGILGKDGCFAERVTLPVANLHPLPDDVPDETAVFVEPLAAAFEILEQLHVDPGAEVAVLGDGKLGLLACMVLVETGCDLTMVGKHDRKLAIAEAAGARVRRPADVPGASFDVVVEATGSPAGLDLALSLVRPRGTLVLKSTFHGAVELATAKLVIDEIHLVGSRCGPFPPSVRALARRRIDPSPLLDEILPLADGVRALARAAEPGALKIALDPR